MPTSLKIEDLEYDLPHERIATHPATPRSFAKLLVVEHGSFVDKHVCDLPSLLPEGALLVVNETAVLPARFMAKKVGTGGKVEGLFLHQDGDDWVVMLKANGKLRAGVQLELCEGVQLELVQRVDKHWKCSCTESSGARAILKKIGVTPIPPYIVGARGEQKFDEASDKERYQTIYADQKQNYSVAAPTAGLHFDEQLLEALQSSRIELVPVTLHVGAGTFKGIETQTIEEHEMHEESWQVRQDALHTIKGAKLEGRPIIAVGTTTVRTLESLPSMISWPETGGLSGTTRLMIAPPFDFKLVDGMLTNFHLPKSTLLTLVAAKIGIERLQAAYSHAIQSDYRFYSYGDAMLILP